MLFSELVKDLNYREQNESYKEEINYSIDEATPIYVNRICEVNLLAYNRACLIKNIFFCFDKEGMKIGKRIFQYSGTMRQ